MRRGRGADECRERIRVIIIKRCNQTKFVYINISILFLFLVLRPYAYFDLWSKKGKSFVWFVFFFVHDFIETVSFLYLSSCFWQKFLICIEIVECATSFRFFCTEMGRKWSKMKIRKILPERIWYFFLRLVSVWSLFDEWWPKCLYYYYNWQRQI